MKNDTSTPAALRPVESNATSADLKKTDAAEIRHLERGERALATMDEEVAQFQDPTVVISPEENKRLRRKINKHVLLVMLGTYFCQSLDKGTLSFAAIMGIRTDAKLVGQQYSWLTTCVYLAILVCELPQNLLIQRLPVAKWFSFCIVAWGITVAASAAANDFVGLVILRTLLGAFECVIQPTFIVLSAQWYRRDEQAGTIALWYSMNGLQTAVGGLLALAFYQIQGAALKSWQVMYLVLGILTVIWGVFVSYWLPDSPMRAGRFFTDEERTKLVERVRENDTGIQNKKFKWDQAVDALTDPQVWAFVLIQLLNTIPTGGLGAYSNIIITQNLGFSVLQADLLSIAQGAIQISILLGSAWLATKTKQTLLVMALFTLPNIASAICFLTVPNDKSHAAGLLLAFYCTIFFNAQSPLAFSLLTRNIGGQTKKAVTTTLTFVAWSAGNAIGPQVFQSKDAPAYRNAFIVQLCCYCASIGLFFVLRLYYMRQNVLKRRAHRAAKRGTPEDGGAAPHADDEGDADVVNEHKNAFLDLTDRKNHELIYAY